MENRSIHLNSRTSLRRALSNTQQPKLSEKEKGFSPSTPTPGLLGKPSTMAGFSWEHACAQKHGDAGDVMKHLGPKENESLLAPDAHKNKYEKNPRRKMREAGRGIECDRKRKRAKPHSEENIAGKRPKETRVQGHMLKRVLSPGNSRDRFTLPPTHKPGLFKKGRASRLVKSGLSDLVFSEMRFLAETGEDQVALDQGRIMSGGEERFCRPLALEVSHSDRAQKASDIARLDKPAHDRKEIGGKIKDRLLPTKFSLSNPSHRTSGSPCVSSLDLKESAFNPERDIRDYFDTRSTLLSPVNLVHSRAMSGRRGRKKPESKAMNASAVRISQGLSEFTEEKRPNCVPGKTQVASKSPALRGLERNRTPRKAKNGEFAIQEYLGRRTGCSNNEESKGELSSSPLSALLRVCSVSPKGPGGSRGIKHVASGVSESESDTPPGGIKEILGPGESRDQRGFQRGSGKGGYGGKELGSAQELTNNEKTRYKDWEGKTHCGGHLRNVYEFGDVVSGGELCGGIEDPDGGRTSRVGQAATCNIATQSLHESLGMTSSERLGIEYLEGRTLRGLLGADTEPYVGEEPEDPLKDMSPEITYWDWTDNGLEESESMQSLHEGFGTTEKKRVGRFEARNGYKEGQTRVYGHETMEDDAGLYSLLSSADTSPGAFERRFWRPNLRG